MWKFLGQFFFDLCLIGCNRCKCKLSILMNQKFPEFVIYLQFPSTFSLFKSSELVVSNLAVNCPYRITKLQKYENPTANSENHWLLCVSAQRD